MTRTRKPEAPTGDVPPELLDLGSQVWRDPALFAAWLDRHGLPASDVKGWWFAFSYGRDRWALQNGYTRRRAQANGGTWIDHRRLKEVGVPWCGSLTRAMARAEHVSDDPVAFRESCRLVPYGDQPDPYPAWIRW